MACRALALAAAAAATAEAFVAPAAVLRRHPSRLAASTIGRDTRASPRARSPSPGKATWQEEEPAGRVCEVPEASDGPWRFERLVSDSIGEKHRAPLVDVEGTIPQWLQGCYVTVGPAYWPEEDVMNYVEGHGGVHQWSFENGHVVYTHKMIDTCDLRKQRKRDADPSVQANRGPLDVLGDKLKTLFALATGDFTGVFENANLVVNSIAGRPCTEQDQVCPKMEPELDGLQTVGPIKFDDELTGMGPNLESADGVCMADGTYYNVITKLTPPMEYVVYTVDGPTEAKRVAEAKAKGAPAPMPKRDVRARIPVDDMISPAYVHNMGMSQRYWVLPEQPYRCVAWPRRRCCCCCCCSSRLTAAASAAPYKPTHSPRASQVRAAAPDEDELRLGHERERRGRHGRPDARARARPAVDGRPRLHLPRAPRRQRQVRGQLLRRR